MRSGTLLLACLAPLGLFLGGSSAPAADASKDVYTVVIKNVEVKTTKADGSPWDINNGKPDLAVIVRNTSEKDSKEFETKTHNDTYSADFNEPGNLKVRPGQTLEFEVVDKDVALNDTVGKVRKEMTAAVLKEGKLRLESFGQVIHLDVELKKL